MVFSLPSVKDHASPPFFLEPFPKALLENVDIDKDNLDKRRVQKTYSEKVWSFAKPGGGGVSEGGEKTKLLF